MKVGIFWFFRGRVIGQAVSITKGIDTGQFLDSPINHYELWPDLKLTRRSLSSLDYIDIPRGRALFRKKEKRLVIYMDNVLFRAATQEQISTFFSAKNPGPIFRRDEHYTTSENDLERLFSR